MGLGYRLWRHFQALFRLDLAAVCEQSAGLPDWIDYHDLHDDVSGALIGARRMRCKRCGKVFTV